MKTTFTKEEANDLINGPNMGLPTPDDVCVTADGRRLDTPEKLIAWVHEFNASHAVDPER